MSTKENAMKNDHVIEYRVYLPTGKIYVTEDYNDALSCFQDGMIVYEAHISTWIVEWTSTQTTVLYEWH